MVMNPIQNGAELIQDNINQLKTVISRVRNEKQNTNPLTMKLNGTLDAAVNGGVSLFDVSRGEYIYIVHCVQWDLARLINYTLLFMYM